MTDLFQRQSVVIRALAEGTRDRAGWAAVCALLDELPDEVVRAHIDELERELSVWSPRLRAAPLRWAARLQGDGQEPRVRLCRVLGLGGMPGSGQALHRDELWRALDAPDAAQIDVLGIAYCDLDAGAAPELARRLARIGVEQLELMSIDIRAGISHVLQLSCDGVLASLHANDCGLGKDVLEAVVAAGTTIRLQELRLTLNYLSARDLEHLARLPGLDQVRRLGLNGNKLLAAGVRVLAERAPLHELRELDLGGAQCGAEGAALLATAPVFSHLQTLSLMGCDLKDAGARSLATTTSLAALRELDVRFNHITATGARSLLASTQLPALSRLDLADNEIGDEIVEVIASCPHISRLAPLTLDDQYLSNEGRAALQALPLRPGVLELFLVRDDP